MDREKRFALLIDADNVSPKYLSVILSEAKTYGIVSIRRIYGDWTSSSKKAWKDILLENSIIPVQQYSYTTGKNASDSAMIIDAMDILYTDDVDGFVIASSDSDFTRLAMRLREAGKTVIGMGESKTPSAFIKSCEEFKTLDVIFRNSAAEEEAEAARERELEGSAPAQEKAVSITDIREIKKTISFFLDNHSDEDGKMPLSTLGKLLINTYPEFDVRNYGKYKKMRTFIEDMDEFEVEMVYFEKEKKPPLAYIKKK